MQKNKIAILSTRPLSRQLTAEAAMHDIIIDELSFIETTIIKSKKTSNTIKNYISQNITAIFTSMNAVEAVAKYIKQPPGWKIYCIGNTTKNLVINYFGEGVITGVAASAGELGEVIVGDKIAHAVFFCGDQRRDELPGKLKQHNVILDEVVVYHTHETPVLVNKKYDGILFFSPSAVQSFFSINKVEEGTKLFAIGATTAKAIQQYNKNNVIIPGSPGKVDMVRKVVEHYRDFRV